METIDGVKKLVKSNPIMASLLGAAGVGYLAYLGFDYLLGKRDTWEGTIPATALGYRGAGLEKALFKEAEELSASREAAINTGRYFHSIVQDIFNIQGGDTEVEAYDRRLGIKGYIDVLLPGNVPVEVKTISSTGLDRLSRPLDAHVSQLNFYLHQRKASVGYMLYLDAENVSRHKVFRHGFQSGRLMADVQQARQTMMENPDRISDNNVRWLTDVYQYSPSMLRGIRHSSGHASSWDSIKPSPAFPGGRIDSITQATALNLPKPAKRFIPTMGLTIRKHETAIGHRSRGCAAKRGGADHCNGSRAYR